MVLAVLRVALGGIFLVFGLMKILDAHAFVENVANFQIPPFNEPPYDMWLAYFLPPLEVLVGLGLILKRWMEGALLLTAGMLLSFMGAIGSVWARGLDVDCGCSGGTVDLGGYASHMVILFVMLSATVYLMIEQMSGEKAELA
ncbi:MauE/DoxX family redox-associated membrane protein [Rubritalea tangerina]|uniref:MauE/DoxX family redox-associated membrane protein n=1 Tax=Rubritalea tangerina TaxID=430798 RepID=UPI00362038B4